MLYSFADYFTDPLLRASTLGSMLMGLCSALIGVIALVKRRALIGEALSHACYPGVVIGALIAANFAFFAEKIPLLTLLITSFITSFGALIFIEVLKRFLRVKDDAALCFCLASFFGLGVLLASRMQFSHPLWYQKAQVFLYGQAATLTDSHVILYAVLTLISLLFITLFFRTLLLTTFDRSYAFTRGLNVLAIDLLTFALITLAVVIGIRSVGLVLMSGMLISPAVAARQLTDNFKKLLFISAVIGVVSAYIGNLLSLEIPAYFNLSLSLPTGPLIMLVASFFAFSALLFAPKRGVVIRFFRMLSFKKRCHRENVLKDFCRQCNCCPLSYDAIRKRHHLSYFATFFLLSSLRWEGWVEKIEKRYQLTESGKQRSLRIIRLHRLWEVYLVDYLGQDDKQVHPFAEKMEHILTPELEEELTELLNDPKFDPHHKPIPAKQGSV